VGPPVGSHVDVAGGLASQGLPLLDKLGEDDPQLLIEALEWHPRAGVCLDTCHAFAAGHDLTAPGGVRDLLATLGRAVHGPGRGCSSCTPAT
jgi:deoxyribonuclease-4